MMSLFVLCSGWLPLACIEEGGNDVLAWLSLLSPSWSGTEARFCFLLGREDVGEPEGPLGSSSG